MTEKESALYSHYIIDGIHLDMTPAELLDECMDEEGFIPCNEFGDIVDESTEPPLSAFDYHIEMEKDYLAQTKAASQEERRFRILYPEHFTKLQIAGALLSRLWSKGHFNLGDLRLWAQWEWNSLPVGNMSAFYRSVESAGSYIYGLGVKLEDYIYIEGDEECTVMFYSWLKDEYDRSERCLVENPDEEMEEEHNESLFKSSPFASIHPWISDERACPATLQPELDSWIIYIPFDTCPFRLGGSLLTQLNGHDGGKEPNISDPDYFIDCYEVVRELVEDGFVLSGANVTDGGLITAASRMCSGYGMKIDLKGIMSSYQEESRARILFAEVPGVIMQVSNENYDYVDSQLLLQDIAYYTIGHPVSERDDVCVSATGNSSIAGILASLLDQTSEGED